MQKSSMTKMVEILEHTAHAIEHFDLNDLLLKSNTISKVYEYFGLIEYVEVEVPQEPESLQKHHITKEGFFGYRILFNSTKKDRLFDDPSFTNAPVTLGTILHNLRTNSNPYIIIQFTNLI